MRKTLTISLNKQELADIQAASDLLGFGDIRQGYGAIPKVLKLCVTIATQAIKQQELVTQGLKTAELDFFLRAIAAARKQREKQDKADVPVKSGEFVTPEPAQKSQTSTPL